jgi:hypothetical protein
MSDALSLSCHFQAGAVNRHAQPSLVLYGPFLAESEGKRSAKIKNTREMAGMMNSRPTKYAFPLGAIYFCCMAVAHFISIKVVMYVRDGGIAEQNPGER